MIEHSVVELAQRLGGRVVSGPEQVRLRRVMPLDQAEPDAVSFVSKPTYLKYLDDCRAGAVILTSGTFLNGTIHIGEKQFGGGRAGARAAVGLTAALQGLGFETGRLKTGTPPRIDLRSIDLGGLEEQPGDASPTPFSFLTDALPTGLAFVSATGDGWSCAFDDNFGTVTCTTDAVLQPGDSLPPITLTVIASAEAFPSFVNTAVVDTDGDENPTNDDDDDEVDVSGGPDLAINKAHETDFTVGTENSYSITVTNVGAATTGNPTVVTDDVPNELVVVSAAGTGWDCEVIGQLVTCTYVDGIEPGESVSFEITVFVTENAAGEIINTATVDNPDDSNPTNDEDDDRTDIDGPDEEDDGAAVWDGDTEPGLLCTEECSAGSIFYPWVANDDDFGLGPADTSITVQNLEDRDAYIFVYRGIGDDALPGENGWDLVGVTFLSRYASKTFTAAQLGLAPGQGAPIGVSAYNKAYTDGETCETLIAGPLDPGNDVNDNDACTDVEIPSQFEVSPDQFIDICLVDNASGDPAPFFGTDGNLYSDRDGLPDGVYPAGLNNDGDCNDRESVAGGELVIQQVAIGGYAKQASAGEDLPYTTADDEVVDGYNAVSCHEINEFDDWYLPIVQTNVGPGGAWNTIIRVANYGNYYDEGEFEGVGSAAVTLRFFPADDGSGSLNTGFQLQYLVNAGDTVNINLSDYVAEGWVGSVHVYSDGAIFTMADRYKAGEYKVWLTTTGANAGHEASFNQNQGGNQVAPYVLFAPDVRLDFFGWNTGINVANLVNEDNIVTIQYFNLYGNAPTTLTRRLGPQGMTYFYDPSQGGQNNSSQDPTTDINAGIVGSALIWSDYPVAVAVDATKYPESDPNAQVGRIQGTTYNATANVYNWQAIPLVQKGNPANGLGPTSGINIMNPNNVATQATVHWFNPSGAQADNFGTSRVAIPAYANGFIYTMTQGNLPNGYYGSAIVTSTYPVAATSAQVDYQVADDGAVIWNSYNPGGFYRVSGCYEFGPVFEQPNGGQITKTVRDDAGDVVTGVSLTLYNEAAYEQIVLGNESNLGIPWIAVGVTDVNGAVEWTNVPEGNYWLQISGVPQNSQDADMYSGAGAFEGPYTLNGGEDLVIENVLDRRLASKIVLLGDDAAGVEVCLHRDADNDGELDASEADVPVACEQADDSGEASFGNLDAGRYWVSVNGGYEFPVVAGFNAEVFGPEIFQLGGIYENDLSGDVDGVTGNLQKVLVLPDLLCSLTQLAGAPLECGDFQISGSITFIGPDGVEVVGNVQTAEAGPYGPNNESAYLLTDFDVKSGGPYTIIEDLVIAYDVDGPGGDDPVSVAVSRTLSAAEDGQVVCVNANDDTASCAPSEADPEIYVYEDQTTRVFNDLSGIVTGQLDVFVRDDDTDQPLTDAEVCLYNAEAALIACDDTDTDGQAEFTDVVAGTYSLTASHPDYEVDGSGSFGYIPDVDALSGGGMDDELGDVDDGQQDIEMALDPIGTVLDVQVQLDGAPINGIEVRLYTAHPDDVASSACAGNPVSAALTETQTVGGVPTDGIADFGVDPLATYCVEADPNGVGPVAYAVNIQADVEPGGFVQNDTGDDIDLTLSEGSAGVLDVRYIENGAPVNGVVLYVFLSAPGDTAGATGVCRGEFIGETTTGPEVVNPGGALTDGIASLEVDTSETYCVKDSADANVLGGTQAGISLDPSDQDDDIDGVIDI